MCWDFIKEVLMEAAIFFFTGANLPRFFSTSYIVLIPKVKNSTSYDKFKPIIIFTVAYKILSKHVFNQLAKHLHSIISLNKVLSYPIVAFSKKSPWHRKWLFP